ncbi:MAG: MFS transporter, partial [Oscillospiraceae bacterium]
SVGFIYGILFVRGLGSTFHGPAMQAAIPLLVPTDMLTKAGGWGNLISSMGNMLGPVLGAALMGIMPIGAIMLVDILGAAFAIVCLLFVKIPDIPRSDEKQTPLADMKQGFAAMRANRALMAIIVPMILVNVVYMPLGSLFPLLVRTHFGGTAFHNSLVEFVFAGGLLVSSLAMGIFGGAKRRFLMVSLGVVVLGVVSAVSGILPASVLGFSLFVACSFIMGNTGTVINVPMMAYVQESTPPEVLGKVLALLMSAMTLAMPVGLLIAGPFSEVVGVDNWFFYSGIIMALVGVLTWWLSRRFDAPAAAERAEADEGAGE